MAARFQEQSIGWGSIHLFTPLWYNYRKVLHYSFFLFLFSCIIQMLSFQYSILEMPHACSISTRCKNHIILQHPKVSPRKTRRREDVSLQSARHIQRILQLDPAVQGNHDEPWGKRRQCQTFSWFLAVVPKGGSPHSLTSCLFYQAKAARHHGRDGRSTSACMHAPEDQPWTLQLSWIPMPGRMDG